MNYYYYYYYYTLVNTYNLSDTVLSNHLVRINGGFTLQSLGVMYMKFPNFDRRKGEKILVVAHPNTKFYQIYSMITLTL